MDKELKERNQRIHSFRKNGQTLRAIGDMFGLSPERIRGIVNRIDEKNKFMSFKDFIRFPKAEQRKMRFTDLQISRRAKNCMINDNIIFIHQAEAMPDSELLRIPNFGRKTLKEIRKWTH